MSHSLMCMPCVRLLAVTPRFLNARQLQRGPLLANLKATIALAAAAALPLLQGRRASQHANDIVNARRARADRS